MIQNKRGVSLLEVLVVLLILTTLLAIALPKYKKAIEKARAAEALVLFKRVVEAQKMYYSTNGKFADTFDELDVSIPWTGDTNVTYVNSSDTRSNEYWSLSINSSGTEISRSMSILRLGGDYPKSGFVYSLSHNPTQEQFWNIYCGIDTGNYYSKYCSDVIGADTSTNMMNHYTYIRGYKMK